MKGRLAVILACAGTTILGALATPSEAATFRLSDLVDSNSSFIVGDKLFSNFSCIGRISVSNVGTFPYTNCGSVSTIDSNPFGLRFNVDLENESGFTGIIVDIGYTVQTISGQLISGVDFDSNISAGGSAGASIRESVFDSSNKILGEALLFSVDSFIPRPGLPPSVLQKSITLTTPVQLAKVSKTLTVGTGSRGDASISFTSDRFLQQPSQPVPESSTVPSLVVFGFCGLGLLLKQQRAKNA